VVKTKHQLIWSSDEVWRLNSIYEWYSAYETIRRAKKVVNSIKNTARSISQNPYRYVQCYEIVIPNPAIRKALVYKTYWIVFEIEADRIVILDIIHGAINPEEYKYIST
jgi:plasmid stabilization system protein ParE